MDACGLFELQAEPERFLLRSGAGWPNQGPLAPETSDEFLGFTLHSKVPVTTPSFAKERRFAPPTSPGEQAVECALGCPVGGSLEPYGVLAVYGYRGRTFSPEDANFLQACAAVIGAAISRNETRVRMVLERAVAAAIAESSSLLDVVARLHASTAPEIGTAVIELWQPSPDASELLRRGLNVTPTLPPEKLQRAFGVQQLALGTGIAGRVAQRKRAEWVASVPASDLVHSGFALPISIGNEVEAVLVLYSTERLHADQNFLRSLEGLGRSLGDFLQRLGIERRVETTLEAAPSGIADRSLDGRFLRANSRFCEITGYSHAELLERTFQSITHADDLASEAKQFDKLRRGQLKSFVLDKRYVRKDGSIVWVSLSAAIVRGASGEPAYCIVIVDDITERRQTEQSLRESEERFRRILVESPSPMMVYDDAGSIVAISKSWTELTGYDDHELPHVRHWLRTVFGFSDEQSERELLATWSRSESDRKLELPIKQKQGAQRTVAIRAGSLGQTQDGRKLRIASAVDVSEQRHFELQLLESSRAKDEFIAMLGHELRNPLAAVRSASELLKSVGGDDERLVRLQKVLDRQTSHMARLLDGLLDISRIAHGKITLNREQVDFAQLVTGVVGDGKANVPRGIELSVQIQDGPVVVDGDVVRLTQIVDNLLSNALKYTRAPGRVRVELACEGESTLLRVSDSGDGIAPELLPNLFKPFQQGQQSLDRKQGGLGLGLAVVKLLVDLHGGSVEAKSAGLGQGAEFLVRLPLADNQVLPRKTPRPTPGNSLRILVIEDNEDFAEMLRQMLETRGHEVAVALDGNEGIAQAKAHVPDVVLCDLGLPDGVTGYDVAAALRSDVITRDTYLVAITGYGREDDRVRSTQVGFNSHLTKPISLEALQSILARLSTG